MPVTIVGTPFRTSRKSWIAAATRGLANSVMKTAARTPTGNAIPVAIATINAEPTIALEIPPPGPPNRFGVCVNRLTWSAGHARTTVAR